MGFMRIFKNLIYRNFLSSGNNPITINLNKNSATLVYGINGRGKSTFIDALSFVCFGKPYRNINIPTLVNSVNNRDLLVELEFSAGRTNYLIRRGLKPKIFEIYKNKKLIPQDSKSKDYQSLLEENILKLNYRSFCQVVVLGSATFIPFMRLKAADRRFIIEDLLDIRIFSAMNVVLKQKLSGLKDTLFDLDNKCDLTYEKLEIQKKYLETLKSDNKKRITECKTTIKNQQNRKEHYQKEITNIQKEIKKLIEKNEDQNIIQRNLDKLESLDESIQTNIKKTEKELNFYTETENCPTCKQNIDDNFKQEKINIKQKRLNELRNGLCDLEKEIKTTYKILQISKESFKQINKLNTDLLNCQSELSSINNYIKKIQEEIDNLQNKKENSEGNEIKLIQLQKELKSFIKQKEKLNEDKHYLDIVAIMLKDSGIKTKIIKQYLPVINKYINKYLAEMDFFVNFNFDENFKEEIKSRGRDQFSYENFSEGEKIRIDLAILFSFIEISRMKNQSFCNLLILDEILDRSLDSGGIDDFLKIMNKVLKNKNIFIISPRGELFMDKFPTTIRFVKHKQFSGVAND